MDEDDYMLFVQLLVVGSVIVALITYLLRSMICRAKNDVGTKAVLITGEEEEEEEEELFGEFWVAIQ